MSVRIKTRGVGRAHGKIILGGEHSVVYGQPAIVLPVPVIVRVETSWTTGPIEISSRLFEGTEESTPRELEGYFAMVHYLQKLLDIQESDRQIKIKIRSDIPVGVGMGSSAAVANAIAQSVLDYYGTVGNEGLRYQGVHEAEIYAHGNPSGLDMFGTSMFAPIWFTKGDHPENHTVKALTFNEPMTFVAALSGKTASTKDVVGRVKDRFRQNAKGHQKVMADMGSVVEAMVESIDSGRLEDLGSAMSDNHNLLRRLGVSSGILDHLTMTARKAGALGSKLSGKGIGGTVVALARDRFHAEELAEELTNAGAVKCFTFTIV